VFTTASDTDQRAPGRILRESTLFDTHRAENLEVHDYLHLVSQEMRKRLGQYVTPSVIVKYILDAVGYRHDANILGKRLADPSCGSGIFLVEAVRVYLAALRRAGVPIEAWYPRALSAFAGVDVDTGHPTPAPGQGFRDYASSPPQDSRGSFGRGSGNPTNASRPG